MKLSYLCTSYDAKKDVIANQLLGAAFKKVLSNENATVKGYAQSFVLPTVEKNKVSPENNLFSIK